MKLRRIECPKKLSRVCSLKRGCMGHIHNHKIDLCSIYLRKSNSTTNRTANQEKEYLIFLFRLLLDIELSLIYFILLS